MYDAIIDAFQELRRRGERPNCIFIGGSIFQFASFAAFVNEKHSENISLCGVICDWTQPFHRRQINDAHIAWLPLRSYIHLYLGEELGSPRGIGGRVKEKIKLFNRLVFGASATEEEYTENNPLYVLYPERYDPDDALWNTLFRISNHIELIQYDEGLGTYVTQALSEITNEPTGKCEGLIDIRGLLRTLRKACVSFVDSIIDEMKEPRLRVKKFLLFTRQNGRCVLNEKHALQFEDAFRRFAIAQNARPYDYGNTVVVVGFDFAKIADTIPYEIIMYQKIKKILESYGVDILFRPHPAQKEKDMRRYRVLGLPMSEQTSVPLESTLSISEFRPLAIIGLGSTAQVVANAFWGVPSVSIARLLWHEMAQDGEIEDSLRLAFREHEIASALCDDYMVTPESYEDLSAFLDGCFIVGR